jgi:LCP family protein required for cell wall assembly
MDRSVTLDQDLAARLMRLGILLIYLLLTFAISFAVFVKVRSMAAASEILPDITLRERGPSPNVEYEEGVTLPRWTGTERITILLLGVDERAQWDEPAWRTDTMMVATLDPVTLRAGVLSIPRDLWVEVPGYSHNKVNTAHFIGDADDYPGGGPALAAETVERALGIEIDYYVRVNFQGFIDLVNEIGGIEIYVEETIDDPLYPDYNYGYDPLYIEAGQHHFDGEMALKYARTRHTFNGDFDRIRRQQEVALAVLEKITQPGTITRLITRAPEIYAKVEDSISTDLKLDQMMALAVLASEVDHEEVRSASIDENCTQPWRTTDELPLDVLVPNRECMRDRVQYVFGLVDTLEAEAPTVNETSATISVLNGTETPGLAATTADYLVAQGIPVTVYDNADRQDYNSSLVILNREMPTLAARITEALGLPASAVAKGENPTAQYDVVVILGRDYAESVTSAP